MCRFDIFAIINNEYTEGQHLNSLTGKISIENFRLNFVNVTVNPKNAYCLLAINKSRGAFLPISVYEVVI